MAYGYPIELRMRALTFLDSGKTRKEVCEIFQISLRTLVYWIKLRQETGEVKMRPRPQVRSHRKITRDILMAHLEKYPDAYLKEMGKALGVSGTAIFKALKKFGISRKKKRRDMPSATKRRGKNS